jgi:DNA-directed RNA polymerase specialized sigma24 family protein
MKNEDAVMNAINAAFKSNDRFKAVKDYLFQVKDAKRKVSLIEGRIEFREESMGAHGVSYSEHVSNNHDFSGSVVENTVAALDELQRELVEAEQAYADAKVAVSDLIARLEDVNQQSVVTRRYIHGHSWEKIALDMDMSVRNVQKIHGRALPLLDEILKEQKAA